MIKRVLIPVALCGGLLMAADGAGTYGAKCSSCHGKDGKNSAISGKVIAGQSAADIETKLAGYKAGTFGGAKKGMMTAPAKGLSEEDIKAVAAHIATLK